MASNAAPGERRVSPAAAPVTPPSPLERLRRFADAEPLLVQTLVGVFVGVLLGAGLHSWVGHPLAAASAAGRFLALPGFLFMSALRACVGPLIAGSAFAGVLSVSQSCSAAQAKALARRTLLLYLCSMLSAVCVGILCMSLFNPGCGVELGAGCGAPAAGSPPAPPHAVVSSADALLGTLASLVPPNVFAALANGNVLGVLSVSIAAALAVSASGGGERALAAAASFNAVVATLVGWILACTPVCIASLIAAQIAATCRPLSLLSSLSAFVCVYLLGLLLHAGGACERRRVLGVIVPLTPPPSLTLVVRAVTIPLALRLLAGVSPREVYRGAAPALATVFATDSSSATLPVTLMCCKARLRLPPHVVDFVIPLGTTVNMDGARLIGRNWQASLSRPLSAGGGALAIAPLGLARSLAPPLSLRLLYVTFQPPSLDRSRSSQPTQSPKERPCTRPWLCCSSPRCTAWRWARPARWSSLSQPHSPPWARPPCPPRAWSQCSWCCRRWA